MIDVLGKKGRGMGTAEVLLAFVQSWELHGSDETSIGSATLDLIRAYLGDRPCCLWKVNGSALAKITERGMVEILYAGPERQAALNRTLVSGAYSFDPCSVSVTSDLMSDYDGFLHIPIVSHGHVDALLSLAARKKEAKDRDFVQPLEALARLLAVALHHGHDQLATESREKRLKAEIEAANHELGQTNNRLIERVKELKTLYAELQKRVLELTNASKAKDEFLSIVSHELRTPLTSLSGFLSVLIDEEAGPLNEQQKKFLGIAKGSATRLNALISDLLDISRIESGRLHLEMGDCSLYEVLLAAVDAAKPVAHEKHIQLRLQANVTLPSAWGDTGRLRQVVDNLLSNAIKFTGSGGEIDVAAEEKGDFIHVSVRDTGP
ncbi:MAG: HAMP domain-containing histidine kinase, partial [Elusimicrobia bacterium]|nr:HAMP domain-containing histidine kinase [Elusimicrobiota bacterium]